jgi:anti-sigma factor RsiW
MNDIRTAIHIHEDDLELYAHGRLEPERVSITESHLLECESCRQLLSDYLRQRLALDGAEPAKASNAQKRSEPRFSAEGEATLQELHPICLDRQIVTIVNVSRNGFGILAPKAILPGTIVQLRIKDTVELANVRYCSAYEGEGFRIGVRLHGES